MLVCRWDDAHGCEEIVRSAVTSSSQVLVLTARVIATSLTTAFVKVTNQL